MAAWAALAFWLYFSFLRQVVGLMGPDEIYFAHTFWLLAEGKRQYIDFYSNHLPTYFQLLTPLVAAFHSSPDELWFLWGLRGVSAVFILLYVALAWRVHAGAAANTGPAGRATAAALLLMFVVLARMVEIRTDTVGLFLVNAAWALLLCAPSSRNLTVAAVLAGLSLPFSARAPGVAVVLGTCLLYLAWRQRQWAGVGRLFAVAAAFVAAALAIWAIAPEWVTLVIRTCLLEPARAQSGLGWPLPLRFIAPERFPTATLIGLGGLSGLLMLRRGETERGWVVTVACAGQLLVIALDPNPYEYVYGWAAVPAMLGVLALGRAFAAYVPFGIAAGLVGVFGAYTVMAGEVPATAALYRVTPDVPIARSELARRTTPELVAFMLRDERQMNLENQRRVRSEICRRIGGRTLAQWDEHPVCLPDAVFNWSGLGWPPLARGDLLQPDEMSRQEFEKMLMESRPRLIIWGHRWAPTRPALSTTRRMLACCYDLHDGFAIARDVPALRVKN